MADKFNYAKMAATALRLLDRFGAELVLRRMSPGAGPSYDPGPPTADDHTVIGVVLPAKSGLVNAFDNRLERGSLIDERLRSAIIAAQGLSIEPRSTDLIIADGIVWTVLGSTPIRPAGTTLVHKLGLQRKSDA